MADGALLIIFLNLLNEVLAISDLKTIILQLKRGNICFWKCWNEVFQLVLGLKN